MVEVNSMAIPTAEEVTIQVVRINWELLDLAYRYEWDDPEWLAQKQDEKEVEYNERLRVVDQWKERKQLLLVSIARRVKHESLMGRVLALGHRGKVTYSSIYDQEPMAGVNPDYQVLFTKPSGDVRITEATHLVVTDSNEK